MKYRLLLLLLAFAFKLFAQAPGNLSGQNINYTVKNKILVSGFTTESSLSALTINQSMQAVQYMDDNGRVTQSINVKGSPTQQDVVGFSVYDAFGREKVNYLPMTNGTDGRNKPSLLSGPSSYVGSAHYNFYANTDNKFGYDAKPYSVVNFEDSPLGRVIEQGGIGAHLQPDGVHPEDGKTQRLQYLTNAANEVKKWSFVFNADYSFALTNTFYPAGQLSAVQVLNQAAGSAKKITYKDEQGNTILQKVYQGGSWLETYYVYDNRNNLRFIIPPVPSEAYSSNGVPAGYTLLSTNTTLSALGKYVYGPGVTVTLPAGTNWTPTLEVKPLLNPDQALISKHVYAFVYDDLDRKIAEKVPGVDWVYYTYDRRDRLALSQDGNQRKTNQWSFTKYDKLNRPVLVGSTTISGTADQVRAALVADTDEYETRGSSVHGYTNICYPDVSDANAYLSVNYFDDYSFKSLIGSSLYDYKNDEIAGQLSSEFLRVTGLSTGGKIKILGTNTWLWSVGYFDENHQLIQSVSSNHKGGTDRTTSKYNFAGWVTNSKLSHSTSVTAQAISKRFDYDFAGRILKVYHQVGTQPEVILTSSNYQELGGSWSRDIHSTDQGQNYYGWTGSATTIQGWFDWTETDAYPLGSVSSIFSSDLEYDYPLFGAGNTPRFDGLPSSMGWWQDKTLKDRRYNYSYDDLGQLTAASFKITSPSVAAVDFYTENVAYNKNGNITGLDRYSSNLLASDKIDQLNYSYGETGSNQLLSVSDGSVSINKAKGFNDGNTSGNDYEYDANGNVTVDRNKGIKSITYNLLDLPEKTTLNDNSYINYTYDASGDKLTQAYYNSSDLLQNKTDYFGGILYLNDELKVIPHDEGRVLIGEYANIIATPDGSTGTGFSFYNATTSLENTLGQNYLKLTSTSNITSTDPAKVLRLPVLAVVPGETYAFRVLGYQSNTDNIAKAKLTMYNAEGIETFVGPALPLGAGNEDWVEMQLTVPPGINFMYVTISWVTSKVNDVIQINHMSLYKTDPEYEYFAVDHLGSTRQILQTRPATTVYLATMETENRTKEQGIFNNTIDATKVISYSFANATVGGDEVIGMNSAYTMGPSKSLKVYTGDSFTLKASALYESSATSFGPLAAGTMMNAVIGAMAGGVNPIVDGITTAYSNSANGVASFTLGTNQGSTKPSAFLNYILFDENYIPLAASSIAIGGTPDVKQTLAATVSPKEPGYLFVYLSYENANTQFVYFDDFSISHKEGLQIQAANNYPYGLSAYSWTREGEEPNNYLYQGKELDPNAGWHDFGSRMYWADLGRWFSPDPQQQFASPYAAMGNTPTLATDPDGEFVQLLIGAAIGGTVNWVSHGARFDKKGLGYFGVGALAGALTAGVAGGATGLVAGGSFSGGFMGTTLSNLAMEVAFTSSFTSGAIVGAASGLAGGFVSGLGNGLVGGQDFGQALGNGLKDGLIGGASGGLIGGISGGIDAVKDGRYFWTGERQQMLRDYTLAVPVTSQIGQNDCAFGCMESIERMNGGTRTQSDFSNLMGNPQGGANTSEALTRGGFAFKSGTPSSPNAIGQQMLKGNPTIIAEPAKGTVRHAVIPTRIQIWTRGTGGNTKTFFKTWVMNPATGNIVRRSGDSFWRNPFFTILLHP